MSTDSRRLVVLRPSKPAFTQAGRAFLLLSVPWVFVALVASESLLTAVGLSPAERPSSLQLVVVMVAFGPVFVAMLHRPISRLRGFGWLLESPQPSARVDEGGLELVLPGEGVRRFGWSEMTELVVVQATWFSAMHGELRGPYGSTLATIPHSLMHPRVEWGEFRTLAQAIAEANPGRYALTDYNAFGIGYGFTPLGGSRSRPDLAHAAARRRFLVRLVVWSVLGVLAVAVGGALMWMPLMP